MEDALYSPSLPKNKLEGEKKEIPPSWGLCPNQGNKEQIRETENRGGGGGMSVVGGLLSI